MRLLKVAPEIVMWLLIVGVALVNVAVYTGVVQGEDAVDLRNPTTEGQPFLNGAPTSEAVSESAQAALAAEADGSADLPGTFVPTQGRKHTRAYPLDDRIPFCPEDDVSGECYASNPPTSGLHLPVQGAVLLEDGNSVKIPPDPGVYGFEIPREAVPHIEEHAGVYVGYNCATDECTAVVQELTDIVSQQLEEGARVVMSPTKDLGDDTIGLASWTRFDVFHASEFTPDRVAAFIEAHSCRFDPEGFCSE